MRNEDFQNKEYREAFVDDMIRTGIAFQVRALRQRETWSQRELGERVNTPQNVISRYENPDYGGFTLKTLQRLAAAFDVALIVKFGTFGELHRLSMDRSPQALAVSNFTMEQGVSEPKPETTENALSFQEATKMSANVISMGDSKTILRRSGASENKNLINDVTENTEYSNVI